MTTATQDDLRDDLRYPVGRFKYDGDRSPTARERHIATLAALPARMREAVRGLSEAQLETPYRDGGWSLRQVAHHVPDSHMNAYVRWKLALTESSPTIVPYDEAAWARLPDVTTVPVGVSLALLEALHTRWVAIIRGMSDADFDRTYVHPEHKRAIPLHEVLAMYAWHSDHHIAHIMRLRERNGWG